MTTPCLSRLIIPVAALSMLAACTDPGPDDRPAPAPAPVPATLSVQTMTPEDMQQVRLSGELACAFTRSIGEAPLFRGSGFVDPDAGGDGVIKIDGRQIRLQMEGLGGFSALSDGATLTGEDTTVVIEVTGEDALPEDPPIAGESPAYEARMTVTHGEASEVVDGIYECGP